MIFADWIANFRGQLLAMDTPPHNQSSFLNSIGFFFNIFWFGAVRSKVKSDRLIGLLGVLESRIVVEIWEVICTYHCMLISTNIGVNNCCSILLIRFCFGRQIFLSYISSFPPYLLNRSNSKLHGSMLCLWTTLHSGEECPGTIWRQIVLPLWFLYFVVPSCHTWSSGPLHQTRVRFLVNQVYRIAHT